MAAAGGGHNERRFEKLGGQNVAMQQAEAQCADYLGKKTSGQAVKVRRYHRRFFVLSAGVLLYSLAEKDTLARGQMNLAELVQCHLLDPTPDRFFPLLLKFADGTVLKLRADHHDTAARWVAALQGIVDDNPQRGGAPRDGAAEHGNELQALHGGSGADATEGDV